MITYRGLLDVPRDLIGSLSALLRTTRHARGTRTGTRALPCWTQAPVVLAEQAPDLPEALDRVAPEGWSPVLGDGTLVATDRCQAKTTSCTGKTIDGWYSGKTGDFGGNIQALMRPDGLQIWVFDVEPGSTHDLTAARAHVLDAWYAATARGLPTLADPGDEGAGHGVWTPVTQPANKIPLDPDKRTDHALLRLLRCLGERGFAVLTGRWRVLHHVTACPQKIGDIAKAALDSPTSNTGA